MGSEKDPQDEMTFSQLWTEACDAHLDPEFGETFGEFECQHRGTMVPYQGLNEAFNYCTVCDYKDKKVSDA